LPRRARHVARAEPGAAWLRTGGAPSEGGMVRDTVAASGLGAVHRAVGALEKFVGARILPAEDGNADAGRRGHGVTAHGEWRAEVSKDLAGNGLGLLGRVLRRIA